MTTPKGRTKLESFIIRNGITAEALARESSVDLATLERIVAETPDDLDVTTATRIRDAAGRLLHRQLGIAEVFDV
jgi:hypothetical protein